MGRKEEHWKLYLWVGLVLSLLFVFVAIGSVITLSIYIGIKYGIGVGVAFLTAFLIGFPLLYKTRAYQRIIKPYKEWDSVYWSRVYGGRLIILAFSLLGSYTVIFMAFMLITFGWLNLTLDTCLWISFGIPTLASIVAVAKLERRGWLYRK